MTTKSNTTPMPMMTNHHHQDRGYELLYWCCMSICLPVVLLARLVGWRRESWSSQAGRKSSSIRDARRMAKTIAAYVFNV